MRNSKTLMYLLMMSGLMGMGSGLTSGQCPDSTRSFTIDSVDRANKKVFFTIASSIATSATMSYSYSSVFGNVNYSLNADSVSSVSDSLSYTGSPTIYFNLTFNYGDSCWDYLSSQLDLGCSTVSAFQSIPSGWACMENYGKGVGISFYSWDGESVTVLVADRSGNQLDSFATATDTTLTYAFTKVGFDTLRITYRKQFCERTEDLPIIVAGDCNGFGCSASIDIDTLGSNQFRFTTVHPQANFYSWNISSSYGYQKFDTTSNSITLNLATNTLYSLQVWLLDTTAFCFTSTNTELATSECYAEISSIYTYGNTTYYYLNLPDSTKTYILSFGDGTPDTVLSGPYASPYHTYSKVDTLYKAILTVKSGSEVCNVVTSEVDLRRCRSSISSYPLNDPELPRAVNFYANDYIDDSWTHKRYLLDFGDGQQYDTTATWFSSVTHQYLQDGVYTVTLLTQFYDNDTLLCSSTTQATVVVGTSPLKANFSFVAGSNDTVYFYDNSVGTIVSYQWDFGDGSMSSDPNPTHPYASDGVYTVCLSVKDNNGNAHTTCQDVIVGNPSCTVTAKFIAIKNPTNPLEITFNNISSGGNSYYWDFGDGNVSTDAGPTHTYAKTGKYSVTLTVKADSCSNIYKQIVTAGNIDCMAQFNLFANATTGEVSVSNTSTTADTGQTVYFWNFGDGTYSTASSPAAKTYAKDGKFTISLLVYNANTGCYDYAEKDVYINRACKALFSYYVDTANNKIYLQNQSQNADKYYWYFSDGSYSSDENPEHTFVAAGIYRVGLSIANNSGCIDNHEEYVTIGQSNDCEAEFIYSISGTGDVQFYDLSKGDITKYLWNFGNGTTSTLMNPAVTYTPGAYNVCLTVVNAAGISNMTCKKILVSSTSCVADYEYMIEPGRKVDFVEKSLGNPTSYQWDFGDNTQASGPKPIHTYANDGYYLTGLHISNGSSCKSAEYKLINVGMPGKIKAALIALRNTSSKKAGGYPVDFIGAGLGDEVRIKWTFGDGSEDTTTTSPTHVYSNPGTYTACYIISDPITGQSDTACTVVTITDVSELSLINDNLQVYPVPFSDRLNVALPLARSSKIQISLYDLSGRNLLASHQGIAGPGNAVLNLSTQYIKPGTYLLHIYVDGQKFTRLVVKQ